MLNQHDTQEVIEDESNQEEVLTEEVLEEEESLSDNSDTESQEKKPSRSQKRIRKLNDEKNQYKNDLQGALDQISELRSEQQLLKDAAQAEKLRAAEVDKIYKIESLEKKRNDALAKNNIAEYSKYDKELRAAERGETTQDKFDATSYFTHKYPWYGANKEKSELAVKINEEIFNSDQYAGFSEIQKLDLVAMETERSYKGTTKVPLTEGVTPTAPSSNDDPITQKIVNEWQAVRPEMGQMTKKEKVKFIKDEKEKAGY